MLVHERVSVTSGQANTGWRSPTWATSYPKGARQSIKISNLQYMENSLTSYLGRFIMLSRVETKISKTKIVYDFPGKSFSHFFENFLQKYTKIINVDVKGYYKKGLTCPQH